MLGAGAWGLKELYYRSLETIMPPLSVISGSKVDVADLVRNLVEYYFPSAKRIWDPTCGIENHLFSKYLRRKNGKWIYIDRIEYIASDMLETKWNCINGKCLKIDVLRQPYPFSDGEFDLIVYDPPYMPGAAIDKRMRDYGIDRYYSVTYIRRFYSDRVFSEMNRIARLGMIVKGQDIYYPTDTNVLHLFINDVLDVSAVRKYFRVIALHIYRYYSGNTQLARTRVGEMVKKYPEIRRPVITHTYFVILWKR